MYLQKHLGFLSGSEGVGSVSLSRLRCQNPGSLYLPLWWWWGGGGAVALELAIRRRHRAV